VGGLPVGLQLMAPQRAERRMNPELRDKYEVVIGIECHVQLATKSKLFCACDNDSREAEPNTLVCPKVSISACRAHCRCSIKRAGRAGLRLGAKP
jgi:hypothetical protein